MLLLDSTSESVELEPLMSKVIELQYYDHIHLAVPLIYMAAISREVLEPARGGGEGWTSFHAHV